MDPSTMMAFCPSGDFARIENAVREWPSVEAVGSLRTKDKKKDITNVFIKFSDEEAAKNAVSLVGTVPGLSLTDEDSDENKANPKKVANKGKSKNLALELLNFGTYDRRKNVTEQSGKRNFENNQRGRGARGGRGQHGGRQPAGTGRGRRQPFFVPPAQVSVAFADNIPFNMTNEQLIEVFVPFGRVVDINRYELMAMVFYDSPEAVLNCIQHLNGKIVKGNVVSVSSGSVRIPGPAALQMGL
ncbi:putative RNA-binding protein [Trypanosoma grayi]|uniref:putative RNA-binding protein n=1 Tax=Trypanosoma grayi TaxID=71804 RepID=UPI0004F4378D|nr:putative RNA-binding protein [Trypanosoma grayi]KEG15288.1 putative RNA-binding protein [Trypanosoma grayi]